MLQLEMVRNGNFQGYLDSSINGKNKGVITFYTNHETPCKWKFSGVPIARQRELKSKLSRMAMGSADLGHA